MLSSNRANMFFFFSFYKWVLQILISPSVISMSICRNIVAYMSAALLFKSLLLFVLLMCPYSGSHLKYCVYLLIYFRLLIRFSYNMWFVRSSASISEWPYAVHSFFKNIVSLNILLFHSVEEISWGGIRYPPDTRYGRSGLRWESTVISREGEQIWSVITEVRTPTITLTLTSHGSFKFCLLGRNQIKRDDSLCCYISYWRGCINIFWKNCWCLGHQCVFQDLPDIFSNM